MENRIYKVMSKNSNVPLKIAHGHFATNHSHVNYYIDMTTLKTRQSEAEAAAKALVPHYIANTVVDTILCLDGTQIIGAYLAQELNRSGVSTFFTEQAARENEYRAFQGAMENNYAQGIMTGFNRLGTVFSGGHEGSQVQIARNEWGYEGWFVTDMVNGADYMNWRDVVFGGGGGCLTTSAYESSNIGSMTSPENLELIAKDSAFQAKMKEAIKYFVYNTVASNNMNTITSSTRYIEVLTWWQIALIAAEVVFGLLTLAFMILFIRSALGGKAKTSAAKKGDGHELSGK